MDEQNHEWYGFRYEGTSGERCDVAVTLALRALPEFSELSRSRVQALIEGDGVLYDGKIAPRGQKNLRPGMHIEVDLTRLRALLNPSAHASIEPVEIPLDYLHIDERVAVLLKPAGLTVHPADTAREPTLVAALLAKFGELSDEGGADRPGIVHRLDKETSGVMVVARDNPAHVSLSRQFHDRIVEKEYSALCVDPPESESGRVELPIERHPFNRKLMWSKGRGKAALTEYRLAEFWGPFARLDLALHTGRTHQIRVHLQSIGVGIINDDKYAEARNASLRTFLKNPGYRQAPRLWKEELPDVTQRRALLELLLAYPGIFLHSRRLSFIHPGSGERMEFEAPYPAEWEMLRELCTLPESG